MLPILALCVMASAGAAGLVQEAAKSADAAAIREVVRDYLGARERGDAAVLGTLFTADVDQLVSSGEWRRGREDVVRGTLASSRITAGRRTIVIETIRFPAPGVAIADGRYEIAAEGQPARRMWTSFVLVADGGRWRISAIRNMLPTGM